MVIAMALASASHGRLPLSGYAGADGHLPRSSFSEGCKMEQQWRARNGALLHYGRMCLCSSSLGLHGGIRWSLDRRSKSAKIIASAIPTPVIAAATALAVGGAIFALIKLNEGKVPSLQGQQTCEACGGSGICPTCSGEGFVNKAMSEEAVARARARAKDAATRYTAGLPRKWNYCSDCSGQRGCRSCSGRGWIA